MAYIISIISSGPKNKIKIWPSKPFRGPPSWSWSSTWNTYGLYEVPEVADVSDAAAFPVPAGALLGCCTVVVVCLPFFSVKLVLIISALYL